MFRSTAASLRPSRGAAVITAATLGFMGTVAVPAVADGTHKVSAGDTLAAIAAEHGYTGTNGWRRIFDANPQISDPDLIVAGQRLAIPDKGERVKRRKVATTEPRRDTMTAASRSSDVTTTAAPAEGVWTQLAACESGGNWSANTGNGYYGGLQFSLSSWRAVGGSGYPHEASAATQIAMGQRLQASQGWGAWPGCAAELGLG